MFSPTNEWEILFLSLKVATITTLLNLPLAIFFGYLLARKNFWGKNLIDGILCLPLVLPPVTTGYLLLFTLGKRGLIGSFLYDMWGMQLSFSTTGAILAAMVVSFPLFMRSMKVSFEMSNQRLEKVAETLGAPRWHIFSLITLPTVLPGLINGLILGFARSLGEFGATITFAGNITGETQTLPLAVYTLMQVPGEESGAFRLVVISIVVSLIAMMLSEYINRQSIKKFRNGKNA